jgi:hypothetical protein
VHSTLAPACGHGCYYIHLLIFDNVHIDTMYLWHLHMCVAAVSLNKMLLLLPVLFMITLCRVITDSLIMYQAADNCNFNCGSSKQQHFFSNANYCNAE